MSGIGHNGGPVIREGNWISVSREIIEHHLVGAGQPVDPSDKNRGSYSRLESWLDLLCMANYRERSVTIKGATLILSPGQTIAGRAFLAKRWNWSEKTVRGWLAKLEQNLMITLAVEELKQGQTKGHMPNVLTICNWSKFQNIEDDQGPPQGWPEGHPRATQGPHYNKETKEQYKRDLSARARKSDFWSQAMAVPPLPGEYNPDDSVRRDPVTGSIEIFNGTRARWVAEVGSDKDLDLALIQIAGFIQPNSSKPLIAQVESQLAKLVRDMRNSDRRYERAAEKSQRRPSRSTPLPAGKSFMDYTADVMEQIMAEEAAKGGRK